MIGPAFGGRYLLCSGRKPFSAWWPWSNWVTPKSFSKNSVSSNNRKQNMDKMFSAMFPSALGHRCGEEEFKNGNHMVWFCSPNSVFFWIEYISLSSFYKKCLPKTKEWDQSRLSQGLAVLYWHLFSEIPLTGKLKIWYIEKQKLPVFVQA